MGGPSRKKRMTTSSHKRPLFYGQGWDRTCGLRVVQNLIYNLDRLGHASGYTIPCEKGGERGWMNTLAHGEAQKQRGLGLPTRNWDYYPLSVATGTCLLFSLPFRRRPTTTTKSSRSAS